MQVQQIDALYNDAKSSYDATRKGRYAAIAKTFIWLMNARAEDAYITQQKSLQAGNVDQDNLKTDTWETFSLRGIFGYDKPEQRAQLSKYKTVLENLKKNPTWNPGKTFKIPTEVEVAAYIETAGGIVVLSTTGGGVPTISEDKAAGQAIFDNWSKEAKIATSNIAGFENTDGETDKKDVVTGTKYITVLCEVDGNEIKLLKKTGDVSVNTIIAKGKAKRIADDNIIPQQAGFWCDFLTGYGKLSSTNAVVTLLADNRTIVVSHKYDAAKLEASPVFKMVADFDLSTKGIATNLNIDEMKAVAKTIFKTKQHKLGATVAITGTDIEWTSDGSTVKVSLENAAKDQIDLDLALAADFEATEHEMSKEGDLTEELNTLFRNLGVQSTHSNDRKAAGDLFKGQVVQLAFGNSAVSITGGGKTVALPVWDTNKYVDISAKKLA